MKLLAEDDEADVLEIIEDELNRLPELVAEILSQLEQGRTHWTKLFERLGPYFKDKLEVSWEDLERPKHPGYH